MPLIHKPPHEILIHLTDEERSLVQEAARPLRVTPSQWARLVVVERARSKATTRKVSIR